jgi:DNA polymerase I-like protein with 3'-5' exonuclease and polymerase domains
MAKKLGHGSNYGGQSPTLAKHAKIDVKLCEDFQRRYFEAFPALPRWHRWVATELQTEQRLGTPFGRVRQFFGRTNDPATLREAIAYVPQSSTADRMNLGVWRIWKHLPQVQLLAQVHDAVYFQVHENVISHELLEKALDLIQVHLSTHGRTYTVPGELKTGWNWGNISVNNPNGLKKGWSPERKYVQIPLLDRKM